MTSEQPQFGSPEWQRQLQESLGQFGESLNEAGRKIGEAFDQTGRIAAAQGAMGWAYRGDLAGARAALASMSPEQLREVSAAASLLAALADEELSTR